MMGAGRGGRVSVRRSVIGGEEEGLKVQKKGEKESTE